MTRRCRRLTAREVTGVEKWHNANNARIPTFAHTPFVRIHRKARLAEADEGAGAGAVRGGTTIEVKADAPAKKKSGCC